MKKIFVVAGELSGDKLGAWYVERLRKEQKGLSVHAVGGSFLEGAGATLYERFEKLKQSIQEFPKILKLLPVIDIGLIIDFWEFKLNP